MITLEIVVESGAWDGGADALAREAAEAALAVLPDPPACPVAATLLLTDDAAMRELNRLWRGQDKPTNVLSFPSDAPAMPDEPRSIGDIALGYETVAREARDEGRPLDAHVAHLVIHGLLHLLGRDHLDEAEADSMEATEVAALARLGLPDPYLDSVPDPSPGPGGA